MPINSVVLPAGKTLQEIQQEEARRAEIAAARAREEQAAQAAAAAAAAASAASGAPLASARTLSYIHCLHKRLSRALQLTDSCRV